MVEMGLMTSTKRDIGTTYSDVNKAYTERMNAYVVNLIFTKGIQLFQLKRKFDLKGTVSKSSFQDAVPPTRIESIGTNQLSDLAITQIALHRTRQREIVG